MPARVHAKVGGFVGGHIQTKTAAHDFGAVAGSLRIGRDPDPSIDSLLAELDVLAAQVFVADKLEGFVERLEIAALVEYHPGGRGVRKLLLLDDIPAKQHGRILAELFRGEMNQVINRQSRDFATDASIDRRRG